MKDEKIPMTEDDYLLDVEDLLALAYCDIRLISTNEQALRQIIEKSYKAGAESLRRTIEEKDREIEQLQARVKELEENLEDEKYESMEAIERALSYD